MRSNILPAIVVVGILGLGGTVLYNNSSLRQPEPPVTVNDQTDVAPSDMLGTPRTGRRQNDGSKPHADLRQVELGYYVIHDTGDDLRLVQRSASVAAPGTPGMWRQARTALDAMADFPREEREGLRSPLPPGARILGIHFEGDIATVNMSSEFRDNFNGGAREEQMTLYAIVNTVGRVRGVKGVRFEIEGRPLTELAGHVDLSEPLVPDHSIVERTR